MCNLWVDQEIERDTFQELEKWEKLLARSYKTVILLRLTRITFLGAFIRKRISVALVLLLRTLSIS